MELERIQVHGFRNLQSQVVVWDAGTNLLLGGNGQGKTSLLEAIAVLGNLRSFRTSRVARVARDGQAGFRLGGTVRSDAGTLRLEQTVLSGPPLSRSLTINGGEVRVAEYLGVFPVSALTHGDRELVVGAPEHRRAFLDRLCFLLEPHHLGDLRSYRREIRQRNAALQAQASDDEMDAWERQLAASAARIVFRRRGALELLAEGFEYWFGRLCTHQLDDLDLSYRGEAWLAPEREPKGLEKKYQSRYHEARARDRLAGFTSDGPHRHDLALRVGGRPVRDVLSSGQTKVVAAALRLAAHAEVERRRGESIPLVVDDVDAELDRTTLDKLVHHGGAERQLFLSSAHREMVAPVLADARVLSLRKGQVLVE